MPFNRLLLVTVLALFGSVQAYAEPTITPLVVFFHTSDPKASTSHEVTQDFLGAGAEIAFGKSFRAEIAVGRKATNCALLTDCRSTLGGYAAIKWSPRR
ncbi:MAG TPA: hypothetical protein VJA26_02790 [Gammaproteobacteria bacterium]|nr:hypothetical protein [Gammaproteobacteria bacterium]